MTFSVKPLVYLNLLGGFNSEKYEFVNGKEYSHI